jgi:hypothetical protein
MENTCHNIQEQIPDLITGTLPDEKTAELKHHISQCPDCRECLELLQADDKLLREFAEAMQPIIRRIEQKVIKTQEEVISKQQFNPSPLFGIITKGRLIKLTVASIIFICVLELSNYFNKSFDGSTLVLAKALEKMTQSSWVYSTIETRYEQRKEIRHMWKSFDPHIDIVQEHDGTIKYADYSKKVVYEYNPNSKTITKSFHTDNYMLPGPKTPFEILSRMIESVHNTKGKLTKEKTIINGIESELIRIVYKDNPHAESTLIVRDVKKNLLTRIEIKAIQPRTGEKFAIVETFEYPENGPYDIYAAGAPRDAKVFDIRPEGHANALVELIQNKFEQGFGDHIAVVLTSWIEGDSVMVPSSVDVFRQKDNLKRVDRYHAYNFQNRNPSPGTLYEQIKDVWPILTIPQVLKLEKDNALEYRALFDGTQTVTLNERTSGIMKRQEHRIDIFKIRTEDSLPGLTWTIPYKQIMNGSSQIKRIIQLLSEDPNHPDLVGFSFVKFAETEDYWFDPNKDHILIEHVSMQQGSRPLLRTIVTKTGRTPDGKWYPKVINTKFVYLNSQGETKIQRSEKHILLDTNPSFREGIFDNIDLRSIQ